MSDAVARNVKWSVEEHGTKADVVVVAVPLSTQKCKFDFLSTEGWSDVIKDADVRRNVQKTTATRCWRLRVVSVLKGDLKDDQEIDVLYVEAKEPLGIVNGPLLLRIEPPSEVFTSPKYLLFLKEDRNGKYAPASGHFDAALSCFELRALIGDELRRAVGAEK
jgi:hypothetical protein